MSRGEAEHALRGLVGDLFPRSALDRYALDPWAHVEAGHVWILDLETKQPVPMLVYEHQREIADEWVDLAALAATRRISFRNAHGEKSRQMGWTWGVAWLCLWILTYHDARGLMVHMNGKEVDDGGRSSTTNSFFGKIRFMAEFLDPSGAETFSRFAPPLQFRSQPESIIRNARRPASYLIGETATPNPGRGGTYDYAVLDEAARIPWGRSVQAAVSIACTTGRLYVSTPNGEDDLFFGLKHPRRTVGYRYLRHHWSRHPVYGQGAHVAGEDDGCALCAGTRAGIEWVKDEPLAHRYPGKLASPWFERAHVDLSDEQVAAELEIDYAGSLSARVYAEFSEDVHVADFGYDPALKVELSFDFGVSGPTAVGLWQDAPDSVRKVGEFEQSDLTPDQVAAGIRGVLLALGVEPMLTEPQWTSRLFCVGDPAGEAKQLPTARSLTSDYAAAGFQIVSQRLSIAQTINSTKRLLRGIPKPLRISRVGCPKTIAHFKGNRWPTDRDGRVKPGAAEPLNDEHNHTCRADAYYLTWKYPAPPVEESLQRASVPLDRQSGRLTDISYASRF